MRIYVVCDEKIQCYPTIRKKTLNDFCLKGCGEIRKILTKTMKYVEWIKKTETYCSSHKISKTMRKHTLGNVNFFDLNGTECEKIPSVVTWSDRYVFIVHPFMFYSVIIPSPTKYSICDIPRICTFVWAMFSAMRRDNRTIRHYCIKCREIEFDVWYAQNVDICAGWSMHNRSHCVHVSAVYRLDVVCKHSISCTVFNIYIYICMSV